MSETVYIKADSAVVVSDKKILAGDIVKFFCINKKTESRLMKIPVITVKDDKECAYSVSILKLIKMIHGIYPDAVIQTLGEDEFVVRYQPPNKKKKVIEGAKLILVCLIIFFGSAFTIMTFNEDASTLDIFRLLYGLADMEDTNTKIMEIGYSIGLPLGIVVFYNHFSKIRLGSDPTPLQTQMRIYEEDTQKTIEKIASREGNMLE